MLMVFVWQPQPAKLSRLPHQGRSRSKDICCSKSSPMKDMRKGQAGSPPHVPPKLTLDESATCLLQPFQLFSALRLLPVAVQGAVIACESRVVAIGRDSERF